MIQRLLGTTPIFLELAEIPPMIGLAVGKKAMSYWPEGGTDFGETVMEQFFGDDLGFTSEFTSHHEWHTTSNANPTPSLLESSWFG
jgi:hypothetical protein